MSDVVIAIDPGVSGAIAWYDTDAHILKNVVDMPIARNGTKNAIDLYRLTAFLKGWHVATRFVIVEAVHAMPKQGVTSAFNFGVSFGGMLGILAALGFRVVRVQPAVWKAASGIKTGSDKAASIARASEVFGTSQHWPNAGHHGRAEAALMAKYGAGHVDL